MIASRHGQLPRRRAVSRMATNAHAVRARCGAALAYRGANNAPGCSTKVKVDGDPSAVVVSGSYLGREGLP